MENIADLFHNTAGVFLFCIVITMLFASRGNLNSLLGEAKDHVSVQETLYIQRMEEKEYIVEYKTLMGIMARDLENDIEINGVLYQKETFDYLRFDFSSISKTEYQEIYEYDNNGIIIKVVYKSI